MLKVGDMSFEQLIEAFIKALPRLIEAYNESCMDTIDKMLEDEEED